MMESTMASLLVDAAQGLTTSWLWWVLTASVKGSAMVLAAGLALGAVRRMTAARRHLVWAGVAAGLVALPLLGPVLPAWEVGPPVGGRVMSAVAARFDSALEAPPVRSTDPIVAGRARSTEVGPMPDPTPAPEARAVPAPEPSVPAAPVQASAPRAEARVRVSAGEAVGPAAVAAYVPGGEGAPGGDWPLVWRIAMGVWGLMGLLTFVPFLVGRLRLRAILSRSAPLRDPTGLRVVAVAARELGLRRQVRVRVTDEMAMPVTWGTLRPVVLLPAACAEWNRARLRHVLLHELAHVRRLDDATDLVGRAACALHWFNPAAWWVADRMRGLRERACDDRVLSAGCRPSEYARDLLGLARELSGPPWVRFATVPMARPSDLEPRLNAILDPRVGRAGPRAAGVALGAMLLTGTVVPLAALGPRAVGPETAAVPRPDPTPTVGVVAAPASVDEGFAATPLPSAWPEDPVIAVMNVARVEGSPGVSWTAVSWVQAPDFCPSQGSSGRRISISDDDGRDRRLEAHWSGADCRVELRIEGDVEFLASEDGIGRMGRGSSFELDVRQDGVDRLLEAVPGSGGMPEYRYRVDGREAPFDVEGRAWLASVIPQLYRETGVDAEERVRRLLASGGVDAVLEEVELIESDYVGRLYLSYLVEYGDLSTDQFDQVVALAGASLDSDYELAELLIHVARTEGLSEPIRESYLNATGSLDSDYEHRRVLSVLLDQPGLSPSLVDHVLLSSTRIGSDYERAELLIQASEVGPLSGDGRTAYLQALRGLDSDYEHRRVLDAFLDQGPLAPAELARVLAESEQIDSDYERAELLIRVGKENDLTAEAATAYLRATSGLDSDYEMRRTLGSLLDRADLSGTDVSMVLELAHEIDSDYERAELLVQLASGGASLPSELRDAYVDAAEGIDSEYERDRALAALVRYGQAR